MEVGFRLSDYELARLANIERNNEHLKSLNLSTLRSSSRQPKKPSKRKSTASSSSNAPPLRMSKRIRMANTDDVEDTTLIESSGRSNAHRKKSPRTITKSTKKATKKSTKKATKKSSSIKTTSHKFNLPRLESDLSDPVETNAFHIMREWKRARAKELGFNDPCVICQNRTLIEIVRILPSNEFELLKIWGIGKKRYEQHGILMLEALSPLRHELVEAAAARASQQASSSSSSSADDTHAVESTLITGNGECLTSWTTRKERDDLPDCSWSARRRWCAEEHSCNCCIQRGPIASWGNACEGLFHLMKEMYGGEEGRAREAGWRWFAQPKASNNFQSHDHRWWPPSSTMAVLEVSEKVPMSTGKAKAVMRSMRDALEDLKK